MNWKQLFSFSLLCGLVWCLLSVGFFSINGFATDALGILFSVLLTFGHIFLFAWAVFLLSAPLLFVGPRATQAAATGWGGFFSLLLGLDLLVFSQYRFHISPAMLELFFGPAGREIFAFSTFMWICTAVAVLLIFCLAFGLTLLAKRGALNGKVIALIVGGWILLFLGYNGVYAWGKFNMVSSVISQRAVLPLAHPFSANRRLRKLGFEPKKELYATPARGTLNYPLHPLNCNTPEHPKNVLVLLIESWRTDSVSSQVMPHLKALAEQPQMTYFTSHLSGGNATEAGVFSLFYSMPYAYWNDFTGRQLPPVLVTQAWNTHYTPAIYASGKLNSPTFHQNIFATVPNLRLDSKGNTKWERDVNAVEDFEQFLNTYNQENPFFGFIFLDATHGSSYPPQDEVFTPAQEVNYLLVTKNTDPTPYLNSYKNAAHFVDRMIARIFNDLKKHQLLENTFIVITGDHGQEINDTRHNFWGHNSNFAKYQTHVPLFVWDPAAKSNSAQTITYATNHYDVAPTILQQIYGCTNDPKDYSIGQNLFDSTPRPFALISSYTKKAVRTGDQLTVLDQHGGIEMYDENFTPSATGADPSAIKQALKTFSQFYK